jgi:hypothetical protein
VVHSGLVVEVAVVLLVVNVGAEEVVIVVLPLVDETLVSKGGGLAVGDGRARGELDGVALVDGLWLRAEETGESRRNRSELQESAR